MVLPKVHAALAAFVFGVADTRLKVASGVSTFPDWHRECRSASVVGQAVPPARPRLTNPTAPRMPPTQPTPDGPQCSGQSDLSAVGCVPSDRKTHPARRVVRIVPTIGSPVARSRTSTSAGWRERAAVLRRSKNQRVILRERPAEFSSDTPDIASQAFRRRHRAGRRTLRSSRR